MSERKLTKKQHEFLECFKGLADENNYFSPSLRELQKALGLKSVSTAAAHADALIAKGFLRKEENTARSLQLVNPDKETGLTEKEKHLAWLHEEIDKRKDHPEQAEKLRAALEVLDRTGEERV